MNKRFIKSNTDKSLIQCIDNKIRDSSFYRIVGILVPQILSLISYFLQVSSSSVSSSYY